MTTAARRIHRIVRGAALLPEGLPLELSRPMTAYDVSDEDRLEAVAQGGTYERGFRDGYAQRGLDMESALARDHEAVVAAATDAGRTAGYAAGREEARRAAEARLSEESAARDALWADRIQAIERLTSSLSERFDTVQDAAEDELVCLCHEIVASVLGQQLVSAAGVQSLVRQVRDARRGQPPFSVALVNPADHHLVADVVDADLEWRPDPSVPSGGVVLRHAKGSVDARFETQLRAVQQMLLAERQARRPAGAAP